MTTAVVSVDTGQLSRDVLGTTEFEVPVYAHPKGTPPIQIGRVLVPVDVCAEPSTMTSSLADVTAYECAQRAASALRLAATFLDDRAGVLVHVAGGWRDLGVQLATVAALNKPASDDDEESAR